MAVPKRKTSKSKRNMRRAHDAIEPVNVSVDAKTGEFKLSHHITLERVYNNGKNVNLPK